MTYSERQNIKYQQALEEIEKIKLIVSEFEEVQSLYDDEVGVYLATGYLLSEENYFKLMQLLEDN